MIKIAIVEDRPEERDELVALLHRYEEENNEPMQLHYFEDGFAFLDSYRPDYDVVFMDIMMQGIDGIKASKSLREVDPEVVLVFVTSLAQYAIEGYTVEAMDFIVKPVEYARVQSVLDRAKHKIATKQTAEIVLKIQSSVFVRVSVKDIIYIYAEEHMLTYVTNKERYEVWDSLTSALAALPSQQFYRISRSRIINLAYVKGLSKDDVTMTNGEVFTLPRGGKAKFIQAMDAFFNL
ncbi:MAG: LytTR family DNA-binding domain-containing protein [Bacilli bacterium]|nr:LytTR family DNA-binding domain-containing protein [Bacilli bacterium]